MDRRAWVVGTTAAAVLCAHAQAPRNLPRVVFQGFGPIVPGDEETVFGPLREGLRALGYIEGSTYVFEFHHVDRDRKSVV